MPTYARREGGAYARGETVLCARLCACDARRGLLREPRLGAHAHDRNVAAALGHARLVLAHLPQREGILQRLVAALAPGGLLLVEGAVPGSKGGWITVRDAVKKALPKDVPQPGKFKLAEGGHAAAAEAPAQTEGA